MIKEGALPAVGEFGRKEAVIEPHLGIERVASADPVDRGLDLASVGRIRTAAGLGIVGATDLDDFSGRILHHLLAADEVARAQAHLGAGGKAEVFRRRHLHEVLAIDVELAREGDEARACLGVLGMVHRLHLLDKVRGVVRQDDLDGIEHSHVTRGGAVQHVAHGRFKEREVVGAFEFRDPDGLAEIADRFGRVTAASDARDRRHAGIIPSAHMAIIDELEQLALAHHRVVQIEPGEFDLAGPRGHGEVLEEPVVEGPVVLEFQGAERMGDMLERIALPVGVVVDRVEAPRIAGAMVLSVEDAVEDGVAQVQVRVRHIDLGAQDLFAVGEFAGPHPGEKIEALLDGTIPPGALGARVLQIAAGFADLLGALILDVGFAFFDEKNGPVIELLEVVGGEIEVLAPVEAEPADVGLDRLDVFDLLLGRIRVVEAKVAAAAILLRNAEIETDRFGVAQMQVAVRLGRETGHRAGVFARGEIFFDDLADEVFRGGRGGFGHACGDGGRKGREPKRNFPPRNALTASTRRGHPRCWGVLPPRRAPRHRKNPRRDPPWGRRVLRRVRRSGDGLAGSGGNPRGRRR